MVVLLEMVDDHIEAISIERVSIPLELRNYSIPVDFYIHGANFIMILLVIFKE